MELDVIREMDFVIKEELDDDFEMDNNNETSSETLTEPSTSNAVCNDESTLPYDHYEAIKEEVLENPPEINYEDIGEFCFESDHIALKTNSDYKNLLEAVFILEAQRAQAIKDLDRLYECQEEALRDPIAFVQNLQNGKNLQIPSPQKIHQLPVIDWSKYALSGCSSVFGRKQHTRLATKLNQDFGRNGGKGKTNRNGDVKPKSNQYWTAEEQKRLEELLVQFPPEEIESRRWEKIANCLENRTPLQVASRVQKYFIKLMKAGIPVPGRMPNTAHIKKPRRNVIRRNPSTFLVSHQPPVYMPDYEDEFNTSYSQVQSIDENSVDSRINDISDEDDISPDMKDTPEYQELLFLKKMLKEKQKSGTLAHVGFKCCRCKMEPIVGARWHCTECKPSIDFCTDCAYCDYEIDQHTSDHHLEAVEHPSMTFMDRDYMHFLGSDYNYLDPNYMPAT